MMRTKFKICCVALAFLGTPVAGGDDTQDFQHATEAIEAGDYETAFPILSALAGKGDALAQVYLGVMYFKGQGRPQDYAEAVKWYRKAAEQGHALAQVYLGVMYFNGNGVPRDNVKAHMWYDLAAAQDVKFAVTSRDQVAAKMSPDQITEARRLAREWREAHKQ